MSDKVHYIDRPEAKVMGFMTLGTYGTGAYTAAGQRGAVGVYRPNSSEFKMAVSLLPRGLTQIPRRPVCLWAYKPKDAAEMLDMALVALAQGTLSKLAERCREAKKQQLLRELEASRERQVQRLKAAIKDLKRQPKTVKPWATASMSYSLLRP